MTAPAPSLAAEPAVALTPRALDVLAQQALQATQTGRLLLVGGHLAKLVRQFPVVDRHPHILVWDVNQGSFQARDLPSQTQMIVYARQTDHAMTIRLRSLGARLGVTPILITRWSDHRAVLDALQTLLRAMPPLVPLPDPVFVPRERMPMTPLSTLPAPAPVAPLPAVSTLATPPARPTQTLLAWIASQSPNYRAKRGEEADRLLPLAHAAGYPTTRGSLIQGLLTLAKRHDPGAVQAAYSHHGPRPSASTPRRAVVVSAAPVAQDSLSHDLAEAGRIVRDMKAATQLLDELLPKIMTNYRKMEAVYARLKTAFEGL